MKAVRSTVALLVVGLVVMLATGPTLLGLLHAAVPVVVVLAVTAGVLRAVWFFTRR